MGEGTGVGLAAGRAAGGGVNLVFGALEGGTGGARGCRMAGRSGRTDRVSAVQSASSSDVSFRRTMAGPFRAA